MKVSVGRLVVSIAGLAAALGVALFLPAGTVAWPAGWAFLGLFMGFVVALSLWLLRFNPDLLAERMTGIGRPINKPGTRCSSRWSSSPSSPGWS
jgi:hypothetical protein